MRTQLLICIPLEKASDSSEGFAPRPYMKDVADHNIPNLALKGITRERDARSYMAMIKYPQPLWPNNDKKA